MTDTGRPKSWSTFYRQCRERMARHYGIKGIPVDVYKTEYAAGDDVSVACQSIWRQFQAHGFRLK